MDFGYYVLEEDGMTPRRVHDLEAHARFYEFERRVLAHNHVGGILVSTVFIGLAGILWETRVFDAESSVLASSVLAQWRERTWCRAVARHRTAALDVATAQCGHSDCAEHRSIALACWRDRMARLCS